MCYYKYTLSYIYTLLVCVWAPLWSGRRSDRQVRVFDTFRLWLLQCAPRATRQSPYQSHRTVLFAAPVWPRDAPFSLSLSTPLPSFALSRSFPISHYDSLGRLTTIATRVSQVPQRKGKRKVETAPRGGNWQEREGERGIGCREARKRLLLIYGH